MLSVGKPVSLIQQKKQQWAQEREEMSHLYLPWGSGERYTRRLQVRNQFASSLELHKQSSYEYHEPIQRQRSPSLPPIHNIELKQPSADNKKYKEVINRNISSAKRFAFYDEDGEGDTSGYGSETVIHMNIRNPSEAFHNNNPVVAWHQEEKENRKQPSSGRSGMTDGGLSARSTSGLDEGRPRWGDRGVATGRLWEPTAPTARLPQMQNQKKGTPSWVERGLNMIDSASDVLVVDQRSSTNSGLDYDHSSYNGSDEGRTFLRGQNVPIEPEIKAQRETKRIKALELQSAILNQLEEREKLRQEEKERKLREERIEELRIQRQQEEDRLRLEDESRKAREKQLCEHRKLEALKKALEDAEKKAKQDKEKKFNCHRQANNFDDMIFSKETDTIKHCDMEQSSPTKTCSPINNKTNRTYNVQTCQNKENNSQQTTAFNSPRSLPASNVNLFIHNVPPTSTDNQINIVPIGITNATELINNQSSNIQLAVLLPQNKNVYSMSLNAINNLHELEELEKVLTPRKYRSLKTKDAYTQTDIDVSTQVSARLEKADIIRYVDKNYSKIDENAPQDFHRNSKKDRRLRSEERYKKDIESRPKWGANKPIAQYKKQSEKDPFYTQKRKIRQKYRPQVRQYVSQSSEDSRSPSPPTRSDKTFENSIKQRNSLSQSYWRNKRSSQDYTTITGDTLNSTVPEFTSLAQITGDEKFERKKSPNLSSTKRLTLSQKFINDKYGTKKLWMDDINETNTKYSLRDLDNNKCYTEKKMSKLDDLFDKKKDEAPMLDLSKVTINTAEEYREVLDKVPDFKTRPEKVKPEDVKIKDKPEDHKTKTPKKEIRAYEKLGTRGYEEKQFTFMDPIPVEMQGLKFEELCAVPIEWRMLTSIRPKSKLDEEYFNRLIELGKSELRTQARDKREYAKNNMIRKTKTRSGVTETRIVSCSECGEEYCNGKMCNITNYDMFARLKLEVETKASRAAPPPQLSKQRRVRRRARRAPRKPRSRSAAPAYRKPKAAKHGARSDTEI